MGEEIDSLADAVNFGVAPAFIVYVTLLSTHRVGWIVVLLYAVCIVLRLARFNALLDDGPARPTPRSTSSVCPRPAGAIGAIGPLAAKMQLRATAGGPRTGRCRLLDGRRVAARWSAVSRCARSTSFTVPPNMLAPILLALLAVVAAALALFPYSW